jgi:hypothetical protein
MIRASCFALSVMPTPYTNFVMPYSEWTQQAAKHRARAERHTKPTRQRRDCGTLHPVEDFLFQYYPYPLALLDKWHPGIGVAIEIPDGTRDPAAKVFTARLYQRENEVVFLDHRRLADKERERFAWTAGLLESTAERPPNFACHGLHEWAIVYRGTDVRHEKSMPLRLPQAEIDAVVESRSIVCSHHDAFRFFAKDARPLNRLQPDLGSRRLFEQPGCVHANMDLYKWAAKAMPWIGSKLLLDCFELAIQLRDLDMRASPYDLSAWDKEAIRIETSDGRRVYETEQRRLSALAAPLRTRLIEALRKITAIDFPGS